MAKGRSVVQVEETQVGVVLELTMDEARTLRDICDCIGGDPRRSRRGQMDAIKDGLEAAGVGYQCTTDMYPIRAIHFRDKGE